MKVFVCLILTSSYVYLVVCNFWCEWRLDFFWFAGVSVYWWQSLMPTFS